MISAWSEINYNFFRKEESNYDKRIKRMSFMALAVMMLAGGFLLASGKSQHVMPKKAVADITETVPETGTDEIVAGDEEVPL